MIIPSRWFSGGKGLDSFREEMLNDHRLSHIVDYVDSKDCFPGGVDIPGGICYFLWDREYNGTCHVKNIMKGNVEIEADRVLNEFPTFIRNNNSVSIVHKTMALSKNFLSQQVSSRKPFGLESNTALQESGDYILRSSAGTGYISKSKVLSGFELVDKWKVIVSKVTVEHAGVPDKTGMMKVLSIVQKLPPQSVCTETYLVAGAYDNEEYCDNLISYLQTKFVRFLIMQMLASMNMSKVSYSFVPLEDFSKAWTDAELYQKYQLTDEEIALVESTIKPME